MTPTFTPEQLKNFAPFVVDEMQRFRVAFRRFRDVNDQSIEGSWAGMATLVHYRCLLYFFSKKSRSRKDDDDVLAVDYLPTWRPPAWISEQKTRCNKMLAHLSYSRLMHIEADDNAWNTNLIANTEKAWQCFMQELPEERRAWFRVEGIGQ